MPKRMADRDVRDALRAAVRALHRDEPDTLVLDELGLHHGTARVDLAAVNGLLHGYEIKSDADTLDRLAGQVVVYSAVLDRVTIVVGERHLEKTVASTPSWWAVTSVRPAPSGPSFSDVRPGGQNPNQDAKCIAALLWREEALQALAQTPEGVRGLQSKPRPVLYTALAERLTLEDLKATVRACLKARCGWRSLPSRE